MPIYSYTAEDAMNDGILHDVTDLAREAGFIVSVRITAGILALANPSKEAREHGQSHNGRLWDILWMAYLAVKKNQDETLATFKVIFQDGPNLQYTKKCGLPWTQPLDRPSTSCCLKKIETAARPFRSCRVFFAILKLVMPPGAQGKTIICVQAAILIINFLQRPAWLR